MSFDSLKNVALSRLSGALSSVVEEELVQTIADFCRRSTGWRDVVRALSITAGDRTIAPVVGDGSEATVIGILRVYYNQQRLIDYSHAPFETSSRNFAGYTTSGDDPSVIVLSTVPEENQSEVLDVWVYLKPTDATSYLPPLLEDTYYDYLLDGLLARMYSHQNRPYTNDALALAHMRKYTNGIKIARDSANRGFTGNAQNWTFPAFGR